MADVQAARAESPSIPKALSHDGTTRNNPLCVDVTAMVFPPGRNDRKVDQVVSPKQPATATSPLWRRSPVALLRRRSTDPMHRAAGHVSAARRADPSACPTVTTGASSGNNESPVTAGNKNSESSPGHHGLARVTKFVRFTRTAVSPKASVSAMGAGASDKATVAVGKPHGSCTKESNLFAGVARYHGWDNEGRHVRRDMAMQTIADPFLGFVAFGTPYGYYGY